MNLIFITHHEKFHSEGHQKILNIFKALGEILGVYLEGTKSLTFVNTYAMFLVLV
jgi:hypothetical protein